MKALQYTTTEKTKKEAESVFEGCKIQIDFLGGRILSPDHTQPCWRVQCFFEFAPDVIQDGIREVLVLEGGKKLLGIN